LVKKTRGPNNLHLIEESSMNKITNICRIKRVRRFISFFAFFSLFCRTFKLNRNAHFQQLMIAPNSILNFSVKKSTIKQQKKDEKSGENLKANKRMAKTSLPTCKGENSMRSGDSGEIIGESLLH